MGQEAGCFPVGGALNDRSIKPDNSGYRYRDVTQCKLVQRQPADVAGALAASVFRMELFPAEYTARNARVWGPGSRRWLRSHEEKKC